MFIQSEYETYLIAQGYAICRYRIPVDGQYIITDIYDEPDDDLIEVKASVDRVTMRLALGQVLDYIFALKRVEGVANPKYYTVLVPGRPSPGIAEPFIQHGIRIIVRESDNVFGYETMSVYATRPGAEQWLVVHQQARMMHFGGWNRRRWDQHVGPLCDSR